MRSIKLKKNDPIVQRAECLNTSALTEVGFIPKEMCGFGCKIYASNLNGHLTMVGVHSKSYGCPQGSTTIGIRLQTEQMTFKFDND